MNNPKIHHPSIAKFQQFVELKDYRPPTRKEYVRYVRKCGEHFQCDPLTLSQDQVRQYFLLLRQEKHYCGEEFLRRFLQHVLPKGFQRVRSYGWMAAAATDRRQRIDSLLHWTAPPWAPIVAPPPILCPCCQKPMRLIGTFPRSPPLRYS